VRETFATYDEAAEWLAEDEYALVEGREEVNPGSDDEPR
jgi:hypothetical protein